MEAEVDTISFGISSKGHHTVMNRNFEYIKVRDNKNGETYWRCRMFRTLKCKAHLKTIGDRIVGHRNLEHTHQDNISKSLARQAIAEMKNKMIETSATPNAIIGTVSSMLDNRILMALPKKSTLGRALQRHRKAVLGNFNKGVTLPRLNTKFEVPERFGPMITCDSGRNEICDRRRSVKQYEEMTECHSNEGIIPFIKSEKTLDEIDSGQPRSFAEVDVMDFNLPITASSMKTEGIEIVPPPKKPTAPKSAWQALLDDSSQCYYYYNMETDQSVWDMPPEYTQFLVQYGKYEQEYAKYTKELKNWQKLIKQVERSSSKAAVKNERFSPPVPNGCSDGINKSVDDDGDTFIKSRTIGRVLVDETSEGTRIFDDDNINNQNEAMSDNVSISVEKSFGTDDEANILERCSKKTKFEKSSLPTFVINNGAVQQHISQLEEISRLTTQIGEILKCYGEFGGTNCESPQFIYAAVQTRIEDWEAGHLSTLYVISKLKNCLETISGWRQQVDFELPQEIGNEEISADTSGTVECPKHAETPTDLPLSYYGNEVPSTMEVDQPPPPDNTELFLTAPPPIEDDPKPTTISRSLLSDYGEDSDEEEKNEAEPPSPPCFGKETADQDNLSHVELALSTVKKSYKTALSNNKSAFSIASRTKRTGVVMGSNNFGEFDSF